MRLFLTVLFALSPLAQPLVEGQAVPPPHSNLKILTDEEVRPVMGAFTVALGVKCNGCHVQGNFASDANPKKDIARTMINMVRENNSKFLAGKTQLTCYTCHRGASMPKTAPDVAPRAF
jgi:hypothetical protein